MLLRHHHCLISVLVICPFSCCLNYLQVISYSTWLRCVFGTRALCFSADIKQLCYSSKQQWGIKRRYYSFYPHVSSIVSRKCQDVCKSVVRGWNYVEWAVDSYFPCLDLPVLAEQRDIKTVCHVCVCVCVWSEFHCCKVIGYHTLWSWAVRACTFSLLALSHLRGIIHPVKWWGGKCHYVEIADVELDLQGERVRERKWDREQRASIRARDRKLHFATSFNALGGSDKLQVSDSQYSGQSASDPSVVWVMEAVLGDICFDVGSLQAQCLTIYWACDYKRGHTEGSLERDKVCSITIWKALWSFCQVSLFSVRLSAYS